MGAIVSWDSVIFLDQKQPSVCSTLNNLVAGKRPRPTWVTDMAATCAAIAHCAPALPPSAKAKP